MILPRFDLILLSVVFSILVATSPASAEKLVLTSYVNAPYSTKAGNGILDQVVHEALGRIGYEAEIRSLPVRRGGSRSDLGKFDGQFPRTVDAIKKLPNLITVNPPMFRAAFVAITRDDNIVIEKWADLAKYKIGYPGGWKVFENQKANFVRATPVNKEAKLIPMLAKNQIDVVLLEERYFKVLARAAGYKRYKISRPPLLLRDMFLALHKKHEKLIPKLEEAMKTMMTDGTVKRICPGCLDPSILR